MRPGPSFGRCCMPDPIAIIAIVVLLLPQAYFLLASPSFLMVSLAIPSVTTLLRVLFSAHFKLLQVSGAASALAFAITGRFAVALVPASVGVIGAAAKGRFLTSFDAAAAIRDAGDSAGVVRLRQLHWAGMGFNLVLLTAMLVILTRVVPVP